ncbi:odorant receptor 67c-like [Sitophilus oryzae]|uniref:Odorant receptor 67c-like n=1 Tax=Sitophilus oryzae TaxID=7048 RepID=A0A6J2XF80_SITOR|nr:odorant receptor 67c-like [Sitophilus oryzae]
MPVTTINLSGAYENSKLIQYNRLNNASLETHFMYQIWFPVNKLDNLVPYYSVMLMFTWSGFVYSCITHMLFVTLLIYCGVQLEVLQVKMSKITSSSDNSEENRKLLWKKLIVEHQYIIEFIETLNNRAMGIVLMEFILSSLDVASVATNATKSKANESFWLLCFFALLSYQIFALAWNANEIKEQSVAIADHLYNSEWYMLEKKECQVMQIILIRAQKPLVITIGPFGPMTTQSALLMFKAAYSYISIMS